MFYRTIVFVLSMHNVMDVVSTKEPCFTLCAWGSWETWSSCTADCGGSGERNRTVSGICCNSDWSRQECLDHCGKTTLETQVEPCNRFCLNGGVFESGMYGCNCSDLFQGECCEIEKPRSYEPYGGPCNDVCEWSPWKEWSECTVKCGGNGTQTRVRSLCCLDEYGEFQACAQKCGKELTASNETLGCGDTCSKGGTLKPGGFGCDCLERSFGHCCEELLPGCIPYPTDVIFILDSSVSQTEEQFKAQLDFVSRFVSRVNVSVEEFQFAVVTFSTNAQVEIDFDSSVDAETLQQRIMNITFRPGATFTNKGLHAAADVARKSERRKGMVTLTYAFVLTDGMSNNKRETRSAAQHLKKADVHVVAIGIGHEVSHQELVDIASPGDSSSPSYVFSVGDFNALDTLLKQLVHVTCEECSEISHRSDIVFLIDESVEISTQEFQFSMDIIASVIQDTEHIGETNGTKFGLLHLGNDLREKILLTDEQTQNSLLIDLQSTQKRQKDNTCWKKNECSVDNITTAIANISEIILNETGRENARKFLVVLSTGRFENIPKVKEEVTRLRNVFNVKVFVIGPGMDVNMEGLLSLATEANHVFAVLDKDDQSKLSVMQSEFSYYDCTLE